MRRIASAGAGIKACPHNICLCASGLLYYFRMRFMDRALRLLNLGSPEKRSDSATSTSSVLRFYVYISETKVGMMYPQVPPSFLKGAEAEVKVNIGVLSSGLKARGPEDAKEIPRQVSAIESYLRDQNEVGSVDHPKTWVAGVIPMRWGGIKSYAESIAFFGGSCGSKTVTLLGASDSIIGAPVQSETSHAPFSYLMEFGNQMMASRSFKPLEHIEPGVELTGVLNSSQYKQFIDVAFRALEGTERKLEFLALVLLDEKDLIVATPLYVAVAK